METQANMEGTRAKVVRCPACCSVFVTDEFCESCGFRLKRVSFRQDFSKGDFYSLRDDYERNLGFLLRRLPRFLSFRLSPHREYRQLLTRRHHFLARVLSHRKELPSGIPGMLLFERGQITREMMSLGFFPREGPQEDGGNLPRYQFIVAALFGYGLLVWASLEVFKRMVSPL